MTHDDFLKIMKFPKEWMEWNMIPKDLADMQVNNYSPGHENASEHDRNGAFHWWLKRNPTKVQLEQLLELTYLDPDPIMAEDARKYIITAIEKIDS